MYKKKLCKDEEYEWNNTNIYIIMMYVSTALVGF